MKRIPRRIFTAEFKREAIKLVTEQGLTFAEASRKLDIAIKSLRTQMDQLERGKLKASLGASILTADQQRIRELERELAIALFLVAIRVFNDARVTYLHNYRKVFDVK